MDYIFILGRNLSLSIAEIEGFFSRENNLILNKKLIKNSLLIECKKEINSKTIDFLGGTIAIGKTLITENQKNLIKELDKKMIYEGTSNKLNYSLWDYSDNSDFFREYLKIRFKREKIKASFKGLNREIDTQEGEKFRKTSSKNIDEEYFLFEEDSVFSFGKIIQKCNYEEIEKRDMQKPIRRESLAISPRLAKIMINLSEIKNDEILLDCFCGVGTILSEVLIQKIKCIGIDKDKDAISGARKNLEWFGFSKENYKLINNDSSKILISEKNVMVSEPDLGETLRKMPNKEKAKNILNNFENLMIKVLNNSKLNLSGKRVFSSPLIRIGKNRLGCDINKISENTGLKLINSFDEFRSMQLVGRRIFVLEKA